MTRILPSIILAAVTVAAQTVPQTTPVNASAGAAPSGKIDSGAPVMTIQGVCESQASKERPCTTRISKAEFERVLEFVKSTSKSRVPPMPLSVAEGYLDLIAYGKAAKKAGVDKDPRLQQVSEMIYLRALGDLYRVKIEEQAHRIPPAEIEAYYRKNLANFEELQLRRVTLPRNNRANLQDLAYREKATKLARELRERAAKGESIDTLQSEACAALNFKDEQGTLMVPLRRAMFDAKAEGEVFALKPGRVSSVLETPGVYVFYKLESRKMLSLDDVRSEITQKLYLDKLDQLTKAVTESVKVDYNKDYFGSAPKTAWVPAAAAGSGSSQKTASLSR